MITRGHYELGIEGLALLRAGVARDAAAAQSRIAEIESIMQALDDAPLTDPRELPLRQAEHGYADWAESYDDPGNDTIALEEPVVRSLLDEFPEGLVLDAACGTGRHAGYLAAAGHEVIGVDASEEMLRRARAKHPRLDFRRGELAALPVADDAVSAAVCALALSHLPELTTAVGELARVLRPGGQLVISNPHPFATGILNWRAVYMTANGERREIPEHAHLHQDYVKAFGAAGLRVRRLLEPALTPSQARARARLGRQDLYEQALTGIPAVIVWEVGRE